MSDNSVHSAILSELEEEIQRPDEHNLEPYLEKPDGRFVRQHCQS